MGVRPDTRAGAVSVPRGYEYRQHNQLLVAMGPDRRHPLKARALRAPINPSISKGCTETEPSCSASSSRQDWPPTQ
jgi:hypothetical protein